MNTKLDRKRVLALAWPYILANTTIPLLGLVDTAVLGHSGDPLDLAAIALGALLFNFLYWGFAFLRMTTTGFVAQATAAGDRPRILGTIGLAVAGGALLGVVFLLTQSIIADFGFRVLSAGEAEEWAAREYFYARIWGAPAVLGSLGLAGFLIGRGRAKALLLVQVVTNGLNVVLDLVLVTSWGMGAEGVGWGSAIAEWAGGLLSLGIVWRELRPGLGMAQWGSVLRNTELKEMLRANSDVMIRTFSMIAAFTYFTDRGAQFGAMTLAANHILLQMISFSAFFLDGFAHVAEALVGAAKGDKNRAAFDSAVRRTSELALYCAIVLASGVAVLGTFLVRSLTNFGEVIEIASAHLPSVVVYVSLSVAAFQLDGIFVGATATRSMRDSAILSLLGFLLLAWWLIPIWGNSGLWWAFVGYVALRGLSLGSLLPRLRREIGFR